LCTAAADRIGLPLVAADVLARDVFTLAAAGDEEPAVAP
jgi:hypothetical protein